MVSTGIFSLQPLFLPKLILYLAQILFRMASTNPMTPPAPSPPPKSKKIPEPAAWAMSFAQRLRYLQAGMAEEPAETREKHLADELDQALLSLPVGQRQSYLDALAEYFPTWEMATVSFSAEKAAAHPQTIDELADGLVRLAPELSDEQRKALIARFAEAGLVQEKVRPIDGEGLAAVLERLRLPPDSQIDPQRLGRLFAALVDVTLSLDQLVWNVWRTVAPVSTLRRDSLQTDLRSALARSVVGEGEYSASLVQQQLERTRQLVAALLASTETAGRDFGAFFQANFSPSAIREYVRGNMKTGIFDNPDAKAWDLYVERSVHLTAAAIEREVKKQLAKAAEELVQGIQRKN